MQEHLKELHDSIIEEAGYIYNNALLQKFETRKEYVDYFLLPENKFYASILLSMLDNNLEAADKTAWKIAEEENDNY